MKLPLVERLALRNYKSIEQCQIALHPLTLLVGRNGAGKSNILDALRFTSEALLNTLEFAMRERGGINEVRRRSLGSRPPNFSVELSLNLPSCKAMYSFKIAAESGGAFRVDEERCRVGDPSRPRAEYTVRSGKVDWTLASTPPATSDDRLYLTVASGLPEFRPVYDGLTRMTFHNLNPEEMKRPQKPEPGDRLVRDGRNLASVIKHLSASSPQTIERVVEYLQGIGVPITEITHKQAGSYETLQFSQRAPKEGKNWDFDAAAMSDGTIRAMGILVSLLSANGGRDGGPSLVGVEEPETALHPAASGALMDALLEASASTQVVLTCHSPDLLDHEQLLPDMILVVINEAGTTKVGTLSAAKKDLLQRHLASAGELLRLDQLTPDKDDLKRQEGYLWGNME